jgi:hypothetical protein
VKPPFYAGSMRKKARFLHVGSLYARLATKT